MWEQFRASGITFTAALTPGTYHVTAHARSTVTGALNPSADIVVTVQASDPVMSLNPPAPDATLPQPFTLGGWALDRSAAMGSGVDAVEVTAYPTGGGPPISLGLARYGVTRPDVAQAYGAQFADSGYDLLVRGLAPGQYRFETAARSTVTGTYNNVASVTVTVQANPQMWIDTPAANAVLTHTFTIAGWAADLAAGTGTGVDAIHVWAYPNPGSGTPAVFWGVASYGGARPDVGAAYGSQFTNSGYGLTVSGIAPGTYLIAVHVHSTVTGTFNQVQTVTITVATPTPVMVIDTPAANATTAQPFTISGWAIDYGAPPGTGPGVDVVDVWAYANAGAGPATLVGQAGVTGARPDVGAAYGSQFTNSGYSLSVTGLPPGPYLFAVHARSTVTGTFNNVKTVLVTVQ